MPLNNCPKRKTSAAELLGALLAIFGQFNQSNNFVVRE